VFDCIVVGIWNLNQRIYYRKLRRVLGAGRVVCIPVFGARLRSSCKQQSYQAPQSFTPVHSPFHFNLDKQTNTHYKCFNFCYRLFPVICSISRMIQRRMFRKNIAVCETCHSYASGTKSFFPLGSDALRGFNPLSAVSSLFRGRVCLSFFVLGLLK
jgi:hypothetical protein